MYDILEHYELQRHLREKDAARRKSRQKSKPAHRRGSHPHITEWLKIISPLNHGIDAKKFRLSKDTVISRYNSSPCRMSPITKDGLIRHEAGLDTYFYMAHSSSKKSYQIDTIDIDCHRGQPHEQAERFVKHLASMPLFRGLYWETSTSGTGVHAPIILRKFNVDSADVVRQLHKLQTYLQDLAVPFGVDVEIKGLPPVVDYDRQGKIVDLKFGSLCRLPRNLKAALNTAVIHFHQIDSLPKITVPKIPPAVASSPSYRSTSLFKPEMVAALPRLQADLRSCIISAPLSKCVGSRHVATAEDLSILMMILYALPPEKDGAMPFARIKGLWESLKKAGTVSRAWSPNRYTACRNWISRHGHIHTIDNRYFFYPEHVVEKGERKKGRAAKWEMSQELREYVADTVSGGNLSGTHTPTFNTRFQWLLHGPHDHQKLTYHDFHAEKYGWAIDREEEILSAA